MTSLEFIEQILQLALAILLDIILSENYKWQMRLVLNTIVLLRFELG
jgi:hypothetical protein